MRLATYRSDTGESRIALVHGHDDRLFDLARAAERGGVGDPAFRSMLALIDSGRRGLDRAAELFAARGGEQDLSVAVESVELLAPLPEPRQMRDGMSFPTHIRQSPRGMRRLLAKGDAAALAAIEAEPLAELAAVYRQLPIYYITNRMIVRGPGATITWPRYSQVMDYELEFGVVTWNTASNIPAKRAAEHIFGYTIFNDFSARDQQAKEMPGWLGPAKGKSFDGANVIGPWIVTPDEIGDPYSLAMEARVNGEVWSQGKTEGMLFSFEEMLAHMSQDETVFAGEFIGSGTVGNGCGLEHGRFLQDGDTIELEVERIGVLKNKVVRQKA
ncbi:MAG TPA: fumarylacetoacetate hydrolase family protein [Rhizobiaceae bacterium]|nr:fumarylacetoacetate hydrolase family protein [Rhizobiaceae bacterium]